MRRNDGGCERGSERAAESFAGRLLGKEIAPKDSAWPVKTAKVS